MTKDEFIGYTKGVIASELEKARIEMLKKRITEEPELIGPLKLIKDALDNLTPEPYPVTYMQGVTKIVNDVEMVPYGEICSCNPKNGGSGICGCTLGNTLVPKCSWGTMTTTNTTNETNTK
jgi:hypothetical protein